MSLLKAVYYISEKIWTAENRPETRSDALSDRIDLVVQCSLISTNLLTLISTTLISTSQIPQSIVVSDGISF